MSGVPSCLSAPLIRGMQPVPQAHRHSRLLTECLTVLLYEESRLEESFCFNDVVVGLMLGV